MLEPEGIIVALFQWIYRKRRPCQLENRKPRLKWFPKYKTTVHLSPSLLKDENPDQHMEDRLQQLGFQHEFWTKEEVHFVRGKSWGDFHAKLIKLRASFSYPLRETCQMRLEVAKVCLFDTGDLWKMARELKTCLEAEVS